MAPTHRPPSAETAAAFREWLRQDPRAARSFRDFERRQDEDEVRWGRRRRAERETSEEPVPPKSRARRVSGQRTSVDRGAQSLLAKIDVWHTADGSSIYVQTGSALFGAGPGRASLMPAPTSCDGTTLRPDWDRAEFVWAAAVLYLDFHAVYRELRSVASKRDRLEALIAEWPTFDQRPVLAELLAQGLNGNALVSALRARTPARRPPVELLPVLSLVGRIGEGAHILAADVASLDLDVGERKELPSDVRRVRDLPERLRRRILQRRDRQIHVRRIPALPQERGQRSDSRRGTALADISFAGHSVSRHLSHCEAPPRRVVDVVADDLIAILYKLGPKRTAAAAVGGLLDRSASTIGTIVRQAQRLGLVSSENTRQAE